MFITHKWSGYNRHDEQTAAGQYLILAAEELPRTHTDACISYSYVDEQEPTGRRNVYGKCVDRDAHIPNDKLWGCVRFVRMTQCGQFMMGTAQVGSERITLSGPYGSDGLPKDWKRLSPAMRARFIPLTDAEAQAYWHPETPGWNSTGSEKDAMQAAGKRILQVQKNQPRKRRRLGA